MSDRPIKVIFDASAIIAFTRGSIDVGEVLAEVNDEYGAAGLPMLCVVEAYRVIADHDQFVLLLHHVATRIIAPESEEWFVLATTYNSVGRMDAASAVIAANAASCWVLTGQPALYGGLEGGGPIIAF